MNARTGANAGNTNPKIRKKNVTLHWTFDKLERPTSSEKQGGSCSPNKKRFA